MITYVFATTLEANPFIRKCGSPVPNNLSEPFCIPLEKYPKAVILVTGMGPAKAKAGLEWFLKNNTPTTVINTGIAGALKDQYCIGEMRRVKAALDHTHGKQYPCSLAYGKDLKESVLVTVKGPVFDPFLREKLAAVSDIVDMEGATYAAICEKHHIPFTAIKCISDLAGKNDRESLLKNGKKLSVQLAEYLYHHTGLSDAQ
jgi:nucleoside phosphorylase